MCPNSLTKSLVVTRYVSTLYFNALSISHIGMNWNKGKIDTTKCVRTTTTSAIKKIRLFSIRSKNWWIPLHSYVKTDQDIKMTLLRNIHTSVYTYTHTHTHKHSITHTQIKWKHFGYGLYQFTKFLCTNFEIQIYIYI